MMMIMTKTYPVEKGQLYWPPLPTQVEPLHLTPSDELAISVGVHARPDARATSFRHLMVNGWLSMVDGQ